MRFQLVSPFAVLAMLPAFATTGGCSSSESKATTTSSADGGVRDAAGGGDSCDAFGRKLASLGCSSEGFKNAVAQDAFASACRQLRAAAGECQAAFDAVSTCQSNGARCDAAGKAAMPACTEADAVYRKCLSEPNEDGGITCNTLPSPAGEVQPTRIDSDLPLPSGGTPADGTYVLASVGIYTGAGGATGPSGATVSKAFMLTAAGYDKVEMQGATVTRSSGTFSFSTTALAWKQECPSSEPGASVSFTVSGDEISLIDSDRNTVEVYQKQP